MQHILEVNSSPLTLIKEGTFRYIEQVNEEKNIRYGSAISSYLTAEAYYPSGSSTPEVVIGDEIIYYQQIKQMTQILRVASLSLPSGWQTQV